MTHHIILNFCGACGVMLDSDAGTTLKCQNCTHDISLPEERPSGQFTPTAAIKLHRAYNFEVPEIFYHYKQQNNE